MLILVFHLVTCLTYLAMTFSNIVLHMGYFDLISTWSPVWQFLMIGFNISGVAIVALAMIGVFKRIDVAVRLYLAYLFVTFVVDTCVLIYMFLLNDTCDAVTNMATTAVMGQAFMCGFMRIMSYLFVAAAICAEVYCLYVVWSLCEDIHEGVNGTTLWQLLPAKEEAFKKKHEHMKGDRVGPYDNIVGLAYYSDFPGAYPKPSGQIKFNCLNCCPMLCGPPMQHGDWSSGPSYFGY